MTMSVSQPKPAAVVLFQWHPPAEQDELALAKSLLEAEMARPDQGRARGVMPDMVTYNCNTSDPAKFLEELERVLSAHPDIQVLYLSAHGLTDYVAYDQQGTVRVSTDELAPVLGRALAKAQDVTAVLGVCYGVSPQSSIVGALPAAVVEVYGFTATPEARDVAGLLTGLLADEMGLMEDSHQANQALFGRGVSLAEAGPAFDELKRRLGAAVDQHEANAEPEFFVRTGRGGVIRHLRRDQKTSEWTTAGRANVPGRASIERGETA